MTSEQPQYADIVSDPILPFTFTSKATFEGIEANGFNLDIPRYVDTFEPALDIDLQAVQDEIRDLDRQLAETRETMNRYTNELGINV